MAHDEESRRIEFAALEVGFVVERGSQNCRCNPASTLVTRRPTVGGGTPFPCLMPSLSFVTIGRAGCTLLGGLVPMPRLTVVGDGAIAWKSSLDH